MLHQPPQENKYKRYVGVVVYYPEGQDRSHAEFIRFKFRGGAVWLVDKTRRGYWAAAQKAGGCGMLYHITATPKPLEHDAMPGQQREFYLFHDEDDWCVELDEPEQEDYR
jgi:hypothetical protein